MGRGASRNGNVVASTVKSIPLIPHLSADGTHQCIRGQRSGVALLVGVSLSVAAQATPNASQKATIAGLRDTIAVLARVARGSCHSERSEREAPRRRGIAIVPKERR